MFSEIVFHPKRLARQLRFSASLRLSKGPFRLHLGCGQRELPGFINIDHNHGSSVDYVCDIAALPCRSNSTERIENYHVFEHLRRPLAPKALAEWFRVLAPGGTLVIELPDFDTTVREYLEGNAERLWGIFGRDRFPGDVHYFGYNRERMMELLSAAGFVNIAEQPPTDHHANYEPCLRFECTKPIPVSLTPSRHNGAQFSS